MRAEVGTLPLSSVLYFASSNKHKFDEAKSILNHYGIQLEFFKCTLEEIQADSIKDIAIHKAKAAFALCRKPVIIEDAGLQIPALNNFPGPYSSYVFQTIGNKGILNLVGTRNRQASFRSVIVYCDRKQIHYSSGIVSGKLSKVVRGQGWGYDPIFIPDGKKQTFAQIKDEKNLISHRYKALERFSTWFVHR